MKPLLLAVAAIGALALVVAFPWLLLVPLILVFGNGPPWFKS